MLTEIVSPKKIILSEDFKFIILPGKEGDLGIFENHTPTVTNLRLGLIFLYKEEIVFKKFLVNKGVCEITENKCIILTESANEVNESEIKKLKHKLDLEPGNIDLREKIKIAESIYYS
tara:strand:+ start:171 stop:524 length:354 start_codon:yes stop_codon:yes gene_type:complete